VRPITKAGACYHPHWPITVLLLSAPALMLVNRYCSILSPFCNTNMSPSCLRVGFWLTHGLQRPCTSTFNTYSPSALHTSLLIGALVMDV
jgi:hypothetical protein